MRRNNREDMLKAQANKVRELEAELVELLEAGDEYHAAQVQEDLVVAQSLARLIVKAD